MRLKLVHTVIVESDEPIHAWHGEARMTPCYLPNQSLLHPVVSITPSAWRHEYFDYWGTAVVMFNVPETHLRMRVTAATELDYSAPAAPNGRGVGWEALKDPSVDERFCDHLRLPEGLEVPDQWRNWRAEAASPAEFVQELGHRGLIDADDGGVVPATMTALHWAGIPSRYVAGYSIPTELVRGVKRPAQVYNWLQYWDGRWVAWDPRLGCAPDSRHVAVGYGATREDVPVLFGVHDSWGEVHMTSEVTVERLN